MQLFPKKSNTEKRNELWNGIVRKAQLDGDRSLDAVSDIAAVPSYRRLQWAIGMAAAVLLIVGSVFYDQFMSSKSYLNDHQLSVVFADSNAVSKLVLSTGETILLHDSSDLNSSIANLRLADQSLDFRKLNQQHLDVGVQTLETGRGKQLHVILADGTEVWLNASSKLEFPAHFIADERVVHVQGEAYFEVSPNKSKPFIVMTEDQQVKVLGTHFNVRQYKEEAVKSVTLLEGAVEVKATAHPADRVLLKPSQQAAQRNAQAKLTVQHVSNPENIIAWKNGEFYFEDADVNMILNELERWYPVSIQVKNQQNDKKISGRIKRTGALMEVVEMLRFFDIDILIEQK